MASLKQINATFDPQEDRLILNIRSDDNSEIRIWLTRRYTRLLLGILDKLANPDKAQATPQEHAVEAFERDTVLAQADFSTEYQQGDAAHPLGEQPVLVSRIEYKPRENGHFILTLGLPDQHNVNLNLNRDLIHVIIKLLNDASTRAEWDLENMMQAKPVTTPAASGNKSFH